MNELFFLTHICIVIIFLLLALKLGKNYLFALIVIQAVIANIFVIKQVDLFTKTVTATDVFIVGTILAENLIQEYFGKKESIKAIKITFFTLIFFLVMSKMHLFYAASSLDTTNSSFKIILQNSPRIITASIFVFFLVQRVDIVIFGFLKKTFKGKYLPARLFLSNIFSQFIDTVLFSFIGLYGIASNIFDVMLFSFLIKVLVISIIVPFMQLSKKIIKKEEINV